MVRFCVERPRQRAALLLAASLAAGTAMAQDSDVSVEINKLEPQDKGCRTYVVVGNSSAIAYQSLKLDLVVFGTDGVIAKRIALDLAPLKAAKRSVKLFDLESIACDGVGSLLVNDVLDCRTEAGPASDCLARLKLSSLTKAQITK
ncbi:MAG: hypothetical protein AB1749_14885 [Pseudomonadota bacterium]